MRCAAKVEHLLIPGSKRGNEGEVDFQETGSESITKEMKSEPVPTKVNKHAMCNKSPAGMK